MIIITQIVVILLVMIVIAVAIIPLVVLTSLFFSTIPTGPGLDLLGLGLPEHQAEGSGYLLLVLLFVGAPAELRFTLHLHNYICILHVLYCILHYTITITFAFTYTAIRRVFNYICTRETHKLLNPPLLNPPL